MPASEELAKRVLEAGRYCSPYEGGARGVGAGGIPEAGRVPGGLPRGRAREQGSIQARLAAEALRAPGAQDLRRLRLVGGLVARRPGQGGPALALLPGEARGSGADGGMSGRARRTWRAPCASLLATDGWRLASSPPPRSSCASGAHATRAGSTARWRRSPAPACS